MNWVEIRSLSAGESTIGVSNLIVSIGSSSFDTNGLKEWFEDAVGDLIDAIIETYLAIYAGIQDAIQTLRAEIVELQTSLNNFLADAAGWVNDLSHLVGGGDIVDEEGFRREIEARNEQIRKKEEEDIAREEANEQAEKDAAYALRDSIISGIDTLFTNAYGWLASNFQRRIDNWLKYYQYMEDLAEMEDALALFTKNIDLENAMKTRAAKTYRLVIVALWYILMYQLVLLMFMYYKRMIMTAVLIILFPLVVMFYAFERFMGIDKPASFSTWVQEFIINVFIQSVHALLYVSLVETGLRIYEADADNWLFLLFAITAIFPMEGIIKSMLGLKGNTVGSLASSAAKGAAAVGAAAAIAKTATRGAKGVDAKYDEKNKKNQEKAEKEDKKTEAKRAKRDNKIKRDELRGGNTEDSKKRLEELHAKDAKKDEAKKKKREKIQKRNERMKKYARRGQIAKNIVGAATAVSVGLAAGGDPQDFMVGSAIGNVVAGKAKKSAKKADNKSSGDTKKAPTNPTQNNQNQQQGNQNTQKPTGAPQGPTQAAANANAATQAADQPRPMTAGEAAKAQEKSALQQSFREQIASRQASVKGSIGNTGVSSSTSISHTEE